MFLKATLVRRISHSVNKQPEMSHSGVLLVAKERGFPCPLENSAHTGEEIPFSFF